MPGGKDILFSRIPPTFPPYRQNNHGKVTTGGEVQSLLQLQIISNVSKIVSPF